MECIKFEFEGSEIWQATEISERVREAGGTFEGSANDGQFDLPVNGGDVTARYELEGGKGLVFVEDAGPLSREKAFALVSTAIGYGSPSDECDEVPDTRATTDPTSKTRKVLKIGLAGGLTTAAVGVMATALQYRNPKLKRSKVAMLGGGLLTFVGISSSIGAGFSLALLSRVQRKEKKK